MRWDFCTQDTGAEPRGKRHSSPGSETTEYGKHRGTKRGRKRARFSLERGQVSFMSGHRPSNKELSPAVCNLSQETLLPAPTAYGAEL